MCLYVVMGNGYKTYLLQWPCIMGSHAVCGSLVCVHDINYWNECESKIIYVINTKNRIKRMLLVINWILLCIECLEAKGSGTESLAQYIKMHHHFRELRTSIYSIFRKCLLHIALKRIIFEWRIVLWFIKLFWTNWINDFPPEIYF